MKPRPLSELFDALREDREEVKRLLNRQGELIKTSREELGMNQQSFAAAAGISPAYLSMVEHGERSISTDTLGRMEQAFAANQTGGTTNATHEGPRTAKDDAAEARGRKA